MEIGKKCLLKLRSPSDPGFGYLGFFCLQKFVERKNALAVIGTFSALKAMLQKGIANKKRGLEILQGLERLAKMKKTLGFDTILRVAYKDRASRIKLEKLAKVLHKIVPKKLERIGLESILREGQIGIQNDEILGNGLERLIQA